PEPAGPSGLLPARPGGREPFAPEVLRGPRGLGGLVAPARAGRGRAGLARRRRRALGRAGGVPAAAGQAQALDLLVPNPHRRERPNPAAIRPPSPDRAPARRRLGRGDDPADRRAGRRRPDRPGRPRLAGPAMDRARAREARAGAVLVLAAAHQL